MIAPDKAAHALGGYALALLVLALTEEPLVGVEVAIAAGLLKEIYDWASKKGTPDVWDAVATILGGVVAEFIYYFVQ